MSFISAAICHSHSHNRSCDLNGVGQIAECSQESHEGRVFGRRHLVVIDAVYCLQRARGAGQERQVRGEQSFCRYWRFGVHDVSFGRELQYQPASDTGEAPRGERRRLQGAIGDKEDVGTSTFAKFTAGRSIDSLIGTSLVRVCEREHVFCIAGGLDPGRGPIGVAKPGTEHDRRRCWPFRKFTGGDDHSVLMRSTVGSERACARSDGHSDASILKLIRGEHLVDGDGDGVGVDGSEAHSCAAVAKPAHVAFKCKHQPQFSAKRLEDAIADEHSVIER